MNCILAIVVVCLSVLAANAEKGFLLICPRTLETNAKNTLHLQLYEISAPGTIRIEVHKRENENNQTLIVAEEYEIGEGTQLKDLQIFVPKETAYDGKVVIDGTFEDGYTIYGEDKIQFRPSKEKIIFVQTDKPNYKPGQEVKFRILLVDRTLTPFGGDVVGTIWIEDPKRTRLAQWKDVPLGNGIKQLEFALSEEPNLGTWKIRVQVDEFDHVTDFEVKEYVLPKFEVKIVPPSYVLGDAKTIDIDVCAWYTYGKPVEGILKLNISLEKYTWARNKIPTLEIETKLKRCYPYSINVSLIDTENYYSYRRIMVFASVIEDGTGVVRNETKYIERTLSPLNINLNQDDYRQFYKPGLPYEGQLKVTNPDDTIAPDEPIQICSTISRERVLFGWWATKKVKFCSNYTSNEKGIVHFIIPPQNRDSVSLQIEAVATRFETKSDSSTSTRVTLNQPKAYASLRSWYSPSGSHIHIQSNSEKFNCGQTKPIKVLFTSNDDQGTYTFYYQISVRGRVISGGSVKKTFTLEDDVSENYRDFANTIKIQIIPNADEPSAEDCPSAREALYMPPIYDVDIDVDVTADMSPSFRILVYYVREDRETVADSKKFSVEKCFKNKVEFEFGDESKQPGTKTSLKIKASPNSLCGVKAVDKSVFLLDSGEQLTKEKIFQILESTDQGTYYPVNHCNEKVKQPGLQPKMASIIIPPPRPWSSSPYEDALTAFEVFGYLVISDLTLMTRPCKNNEVYYDNYPVPMDSVGVRGGAFAQSGSGGIKRIGYRPMALASNAGPPGASASKVGMPAGAKSAVEVRNYFPETWLFKMQIVDNNGEMIWKETLPHTITEWRGNAICVQEQDGLGLSEEAAMKGFQVFFVSLTLPYSVVRGEKISIPAKVFNYLDEDLPLSLSVEDSPGFSLLGSPTIDFCLPGDKSDTFPIQLEAIALGKLNITVRVESKDGACGEGIGEILARDAVTQSLIIEPEGFPQEEVSSTLFCPQDAENNIFEKNFVLTLPKDLVLDSARAYLIITGNIMGPAIENLDQLVVMPTGCGEQNMVKFTPNIFVLDYLEATRQLTETIKAKVLNNLNKGAQNQMKYRHSDGSYSAFGPSDREGSIILTSFVLRSFAQANKYITIDYESFGESLKWVLSKQLFNGCFPEVGRTVGSQLKNGIENQSGMRTAYILSSLLIGGLENRTIIEPALKCIEEDEEAITPYKASLYAYTATLAENSEMADKYMKILNTKANQTGDETSFKNINGSLSLDIQTAAYAVMTILKMDGKAKDALPIVRWMTSKRNSRGGFVSTQDTVLGLEALAEFARITGSSPVQLKTATSGALELKVDISEDDKLVVREYKIPNVPAEVIFLAEGTGCGLIQTVLRYNTISPPQTKLFTFNIGSECVDEGCKIAKIHVCTSYIPEGKLSNMAIVEVKMVSGMMPVQDSLTKIMRDGTLGLKRFEVENNNAFFYFYEISNEVKCFEFAVEEVIHVEDRQPAPAKVYDYYAKENSASASYMLGDCENSGCSKETEL